MNRRVAEPIIIEHYASSMFLPGEIVSIGSPWKFGVVVAVRPGRLVVRRLTLAERIGCWVSAGRRWLVRRLPARWQGRLADWQVQRDFARMEKEHPEQWQ